MGISHINVVVEILEKLLSLTERILFTSFLIGHGCFIISGFYLAATDYVTY